jgi:hypothetical protein
MSIPTNGWTAVRPNWNGALGMYWHVQPIRVTPTFNPGTWKPLIPGKVNPPPSMVGQPVVKGTTPSA